MSLRDEAPTVVLRNPAAICTVERVLLHTANPIDPAIPPDWPDRADWLDAVNGFPRLTASGVERLIARRNIRVTAERITRHRRRECLCAGDLRAPLVPA